MLEHHTVHVNWHMGLVVKNISQYCKSILYLINCGWAYYHFNVALFFFITKNLIPFLIFFPDTSDRSERHGTAPVFENIFTS